MQNQFLAHLKAKEQIQYFERKAELLMYLDKLQPIADQLNVGSEWRAMVSTGNSAAAEKVGEAHDKIPVNACGELVWLIYEISDTAALFLHFSEHGYVDSLSFMLQVFSSAKKDCVKAMRLYLCLN
jgi:hypothetical protein